jgi:hypothetical protein
VGSSCEWEEMAPWRLALRRLSFKALVPFYALLRLTIPLVDPGTYSQQWLVVAMLCRQVPRHRCRPEHCWQAVLEATDVMMLTSRRSTRHTCVSVL